MSSFRTNRIAQICLLAAWLVIVIGEYTLTVNSQNCPKPTYMNPTAYVGAWLPSTRVNVQIDEAFSSDKATGIAEGNAKWNEPSLIACSGVSFNHFDSVPMEITNSPPPRGHLHWQEQDPGTGFSAGVFADFGFAGFVVAVRVRVKPGVVNIAQGTYFNYLGTHEVGHTFNLNDCISITGCSGSV